MRRTNMTMSPDEDYESDQDTKAESASSPYDYAAVITCEERSLKLYKGKSPYSAMSAYREAVSILGFLNCSGKVNIELLEPRSPYRNVGGFATKLEEGRVTSLHQPHGLCADWPLTMTWAPKNRYK